jgi:hypothetical protein
MRSPPDVDPLARLWLLDADVRGLVCCALCVGIVLVGTFGIISELLYLAALAPGVLLCRRATALFRVRTFFSHVPPAPQVRAETLPGCGDSVRVCTLCSGGLTPYTHFTGLRAACYLCTCTACWLRRRRQRAAQSGGECPLFARSGAYAVGGSNASGMHLCAMSHTAPCVFPLARASRRSLLRQFWKKT